MKNIFYNLGARGVLVEIEGLVFVSKCMLWLPIKITFFIDIQFSKKGFRGLNDVKVVVDVMQTCLCVVIE